MRGDDDLEFFPHHTFTGPESTGKKIDRKKERIVEELERSIAKTNINQLIHDYHFSFFSSWACKRSFSELKAFATKSPLTEHEIKQLCSIAVDGARFLTDASSVDLLDYLLLNYSFRISYIYKNRLLRKTAVACEEDKVAILVRHGADINSKHSDGDTPLLKAFNHTNWNTAEGLLKLGANPNIKDSRGDAPLHIVVNAKHRNLPIMEKLLDYGADPDIQNRDGYTPLMLTVEKGRLRMAQLLLAHGADSTLKNAELETFLDLARDRPAMVDLLKLKKIS